jgi:hypothetical protein
MEQNLYRLEDNTSVQYVYGTEKALDDKLAANPGMTAMVTTYEEGESAGNYWDSLDYPRGN